MYGYRFANAGSGIGWGGLCLLLLILILLCPNTAEALAPEQYQSGKPQGAKIMNRSTGAGLFSGTQSPDIQAYCDGLNISDYSCRRIDRIVFLSSKAKAASAIVWDSNQTERLGSSDSDPPYYDSWGDARMVASPQAESGIYYCMSLSFGPPIPSGWNMEFRWTVGSNPSGANANRSVAVDVHYGAGTVGTTVIKRSAAAGRFRENIEGGTAFLAWQESEQNFGSPIPEVRWCVYTTTPISATVYNRVRIDGVLFGTGREEFCRSGVTDDSCVSVPDDFIDSYCTALDLSSEYCQLVSRLVFNRSGIGEHVWDPTHSQASAEGGSSSVLSPPVKRGEYSCMSLYFDQPNPQGAEFSFAWDLSRRAAVSGESGQQSAYMRFFLFAPEAGADHNPADLSVRSEDASYSLGTEGSGFEGWTAGVIGNPATETGELKWCYYGGNSDVGEVDRGRVDRLEMADGPVSESTDSRVAIEKYCTALDIEDALCTRVSSIDFLGFNAGQLAWDPNHAMGAVPGDMLSVASQQVGSDGYSCLSLYFSEEPIARGSAISFQWAVGRGAGSDSSSLLFWLAPTGDDRLPTVDPEQPGISQSQAGFSAWMEHSAVAIVRAVTELRWCYFGAVSSAGEMDIGRVDRLEVDEGIEVSFVLPDPNPGPAIVEGMTVSILVVSPIPFADGESVLIRLLVEEGQRFLDPNGPNVVAEGSSRLVLELPFTGDGAALEHALMLPTHDDDRDDPDGNIRLALAEPPPAAGYRLGTPSGGFLIAVKDNDYRPNAEGLIRWWQLLRRCKAPNGCPTPSGSAPTLLNNPNLAMRTENELEGIAVTFQDLLADETLDVNGDMSYDTMDLRIILRYLAGLRGGALVESDDADKARLQALER